MFQDITLAIPFFCNVDAYSILESLYTVCVHVCAHVRETE